MKIRYLFLLLAFCCNTGWADFSDTLFRLHPIQPKKAEPYLIEITGEWPDDCHRGEQKPAIRDYTGDTAHIVYCLPPAPISARFSIRNIEGKNIAEIVCGFVENNWILDEMICRLDSPNLEDGDNPYRVELLSIERIKMTYAGAILRVGSRSNGTAVRID